MEQILPGGENNCLHFIRSNQQNETQSTIVNFYLPYKLNFRKISAFIYKYWEKDKLQVAFVILNSLESLRECNILTDMTGIQLKAPVLVETDVRRLLQLCRDSINPNWM